MKQRTPWIDWDIRHVSDVPVDPSRMPSLSSPCAQDKPPLRCSRCKDKGHCGTLLFEHDWQGELWVVCLVCWVRRQRGLAPSAATGSTPVSADDEPVVPTDEETAAFMKLRKASWRTRTNSSKALLRTKTIKEQLRDVPREKDESRRHHQRRVISTAAALICKFMESFQKLSPEDKADVEQAFERWAELHEKVSADPSLAIGLDSCGLTTTSEAIDMASEIMSGISEFYVCRSIRTEWFDARCTTAEEAAAAGYQPAGTAVAATGSTPVSATPLPKRGAKWESVQTHCGAFSPAQHWACTDRSFAGGHYRCARCGVLYQPWVSGDKFAPMNKLLIVETSNAEVARFWRTRLTKKEHAEMEPVSTTAPTAATGSTPVSADKELIFVPFWWAQSSEQALGDRLKQITLKTGDELKDKPLHELPQLIADLALKEQLKKVWWTKGSLTEKAKEVIDQVNSTTTRETFVYDHLLEGFPQARFVWKAGQVVWSQDDLARAYALMRISIREAKREAEAARSSSSRRGRGQ